jgi:hypothetical protein
MRQSSLPRWSIRTPSSVAVASVLRGEVIPFRTLNVTADEVIAGLEEQRLGPLVDRAGIPEDWPEAIAEAARAQARAYAVIDTIQRREIRSVSEALGRERVSAVIFKGAALGFTIYPDPALRPHEDIDLLVDEPAVETAARGLRRLGYIEGSEPAGRVSTHQRHFLRQEGSIRHACDLHWRIANPHVFAHSLSTDTLLGEAVALPQAGPTGWTLSPEHALLVAAMHRVAHHDGADLLWLYDIYLMSGKLDEPLFDRVRDLAGTSRMKAVLADALSVSSAMFGRILPERVQTWCEANRHTGEPAEKFLSGTLRAVDVLWTDLRAIPDWPTRLRLLRERLFPPAEFMRARSGNSRLPVAILYGRRLWRGVPKWMSR